MRTKDESPRIIAIRLHEEEKLASQLRIEKLRSELAQVRTQYDLFKIYGQSRRQSPAPGHIILVLQERKQAAVELYNRTLIRLVRICQIHPGERHWCKYQDNDPWQKKRYAKVLYPLVDCEKTLKSLRDQFNEMNAWHRAKFGW